MLRDLTAVRTQHFKADAVRLDIPLWTTSGRRSKHLVPFFCVPSVSGSALIGSTRALFRVSRLAVSSVRHREMSLGLKMRAADTGTVFWKKVRSSTFMARLIGGANMSAASVEAIEEAGARGCCWAEVKCDVSTIMPAVGFFLG